MRFRTAQKWSLRISIPLPVRMYVQIAEYWNWEFWLVHGLDKCTCWTSARVGQVHVLDKCTCWTSARVGQVHVLDKWNTAVLQERDKEFYLLQRVQTGCVTHKSHCLISNVCALPWDNAARLLARIQYKTGPAIGHIGTGFSSFPSVYKRMLRWFPRLQVATECFSCSPPDLNFLDPYFTRNVMFISYLCKWIITTATGWQRIYS
jgi:hypothetical protein